MAEERRQYPRAESDWTATIQQGRLRFNGIVQNVSHRGAYICCDRKVLPTERVRIAIRHSHHVPLVIDAEARWSRILTQDQTGVLYGVGFRITDITDVAEEDRGLTETATFTSGKACPECESTSRYRIRRRFWMRLLPDTKFYYCEDCGCNYVTVFEWFSFRWGDRIRY